jgi:HAD superfamily hydrolase (TIGR01549 family)
MAITAVVFDVGETLINEARLWNGWAAYLGVQPDVFQSVLEDVIAKGEHHRRVFERFNPGFDIDAARQERAARGDIDALDAIDIYPDALPCLRRLRQLGYVIGIAGNQPRGADEALKRIGFEVDFIASSTSLGAEKPSPDFFVKVAEMANVPSSSIAYVGDRLDNDVHPAREAGMVAIFIERGPWGRAHAKRPEIARANLAVTSLRELPKALATITFGR